MPVRKIPLLENHIYHIYNRWFEKQWIYRSINDFERFLSLMQKYLTEHPWVNLYSYAILPNHFHFIIHIRTEWNQLSIFMSKLQQAYSMYFQLKYRSSIPGLKWRSLFEWRFKAKLIDTDEYLYQCLAYVNYNPVKHNLVKNIEDYPYTSYHQMMHGKKRVPLTWDYKKAVQVWKDVELSEFEF